MLGGNIRRPEEPTDANGFHDRGNRYSRNGSYERAIADYNQAIDMDGAFADAYYDRGFSFYELALYDQALAGSEALVPLVEPPGSYSNYYKYVVFLPRSVNRAELKKLLRECYGVP